MTEILVDQHADDFKLPQVSTYGPEAHTPTPVRSRVSSAARDGSDFGERSRAQSPAAASLEHRYADVFPDQPHYPPYPYPPEELDTPFKQKYPPDPFGEEMGENARVWKVYQDEATIRDGAMLDGWNKSLDILLIFAGLFSAVATAFIIESYQLLQPDFTEYSARALYVLVSIRNGSAGWDPAVSLPDPSRVSVSLKSRWINGLWVTSLFTALAVALLCILVKQWLTQYKDRTTHAASSGLYWARRRSLYHRGLTRWRLPALISTLPLLLHISLFLFFVGLVLVFTTLDAVIAVVLLVLTVALFGLYITSILLPAQIVDYPSSTPLLDQLRTLFSALIYPKPSASYNFARNAALYTNNWSFARCYAGCYRYLTRAVRLAVEQAASTTLCFNRLLHALKRWNYRRKWGDGQDGPWTITRAEATAISRESESGLDAVTLLWMLHECTTYDIRTVACQAAAALHPASRIAKILRHDEWIRIHLEWCFEKHHPDLNSFTDAADLSRCSRAYLCLAGECFTWQAWVQKYLDFYDLRLVSDAMYVADERPTETTPAGNRSRMLRCQPFLTCTGLQVLADRNCILETRLLVLCGLDASRVGPHDVDSIVRTTRRALDQPQHEWHALCDHSCAIDMICEFILNPIAYDITNLTRRETIQLVLRLITFRSGELCAIRCPRGLPFASVRHIWSLAASEFVSTDWTDLEVYSFSQFIAHIAPPGAALQPSEGCNLVIGTLSRLLQVVQSMSDTLPPVPEPYPGWSNQARTLNFVALALRRVFSLPGDDKEYPDPHLTHIAPLAIRDTNDRDLASTLIGPLTILLRAGAAPSMWQLLNVNLSAQRFSMSEDIAALADIIATHLSFHIRQRTPRVEELVSEFFAHNIGWGRRLIEYIARPWLSSYPATNRPTPTNAFRCLAHCIELNPGWWPAVLETVEQLEAEDAVKATARDVDAMIQRGDVQPCELCNPRAGRG